MNSRAGDVLKVLTVVGSVGFAAGPASADLITFNFTGTVTSTPSPPPLGLEISVGDPVAGQIYYDPLGAPSFNTGTVAGYIQPPPSGMTILIGGSTIKSEGNASLQMLNNSFGIDNFNGFFTPISINGQLITDPGFAINFSLTDSSETVFSSPVPLPQTLDVADFNQRTGAFFVGFGVTIFFSIDTIELEVEAITVGIDIKPGSFPNSINPDDQGKTPVAILTTLGSDDLEPFDATTVDPDTVRFGTTGGEAAPVHYAFEDVDGNDAPDLVLQFNTQDTGIACGDDMAILTGETNDGKPIVGTDHVHTVPCP